MGRLEIRRFAVVTIIEGKITAKNELLVVIMIQHHRRGGNRQKNCRLVGIVYQAMKRVERRREQTAALPANILRHPIALLNLSNAFSLNHVNDLFVEVPFGM